MNRFKNLLFKVAILGVALSTISCASSISSIKRKVSIDGVDDLQIKGITGVTADLILSNESYHNIVVEEVDVDLKDGEKKALTMVLVEPLTIPRRSKAVAVPTRWRIEDASPLALLSLSGRVLKQRNLEGLAVDVDARAGVKLYKRDFKYRDIPLTRIVNSAK